MKKIALLALIFAGFTQAATITFSYIPPSMNSGDSFDLQVGVIPNSGEQINLFSVDLEYSNFLTVTTVTEDGYFAANGFAFSPGTASSTSDPGMSLITSISDLLFPPDYDPSADTLFDVVFTAASAGSPVVTLGPNSFLQDASGAADPINGVTYLTPEPSSALLGAAGLGIRVMRSWRRRRA